MAISCVFFEKDYELQRRLQECGNEIEFVDFPKNLQSMKAILHFVDDKTKTV